MNLRERRDALVAKAVQAHERLQRRIGFEQRVALIAARESARRELASVEDALAGDAYVCNTCGCLVRGAACPVCASELAAELEAARVETIALAILGDAVAATEGEDHVEEVSEGN